MFAGWKIAVVVPAFNEERKVARAVAAVPSFVDHVLVVDDASRDRTFFTASALRRPGLEVLQHPRNRGVGAAIESGYRRALELEVDAAVVMAGDGQMDPLDLPSLLAPLCDGRADYTKGNRFAGGKLWGVMPVARIAGNVALSLATRVTSGYRQLFDSQCGYTAASRAALEVLCATGLFPRYGYLNDLLARLHTARLRVVDVPVRAVYGREWSSGIGLHTVIYPVSFVLLRAWARRLVSEYVPGARGVVQSAPSRPPSVMRPIGARAVAEPVRAAG